MKNPIGIQNFGEVRRDGKAHEWPLYDTTDKQVMVLDEQDIHTAKESELKIVDWNRTYILTNTYFN
ncbi:MAG: hypothetical protein IJP74_08715 [Prevotella sp.]|nr:hypothetical protein [Prevotella sp.]